MLRRVGHFDARNRSDGVGAVLQLGFDTYAGCGPLRASLTSARMPDVECREIGFCVDGPAAIAPARVTTRRVKMPCRTFRGLPSYDVSSLFLPVAPSSPSEMGVLDLLPQTARRASGAVGIGVGVPPPAPPPPLGLLAARRESNTTERAFIRSLATSAAVFPAPPPPGAFRCSRARRSW